MQLLPLSFNDFQMLTDNADLCSTMCREQLEHMFLLATSSTNSDHLELYTALQAAIKVQYTGTSESFSALWVCLYKCLCTRVFSGRSAKLHQELCPLTKHLWPSYLKNIRYDDEC